MKKNETSFSDRLLIVCKSLLAVLFCRKKHKIDVDKCITLTSIRYKSFVYNVSRLTFLIQSNTLMLFV